MNSRQKTSAILPLFVVASLLSSCAGFASSQSNNSVNQEERAANTSHNEFSSQVEPAPYTMQPEAQLSDAAQVVTGQENEKSESSPDQDYGALEEPALESGEGSGGIAVESIAPVPSPLPTQSPPNDTPFHDTYFHNYGTSPFIDTEDDHLSTFALDVDTGSFTIARNYINEGYLPPVDSVRVEEFINYFGQGYPDPSFQDTFGIYIDGAPAPFTETDGYQMIRIGIQGVEIPVEDRKSAVLTFVVDVSGSMGNDARLELVKDAMALLVEQLRSDDVVSIVAYSDTAWVVLEPTNGQRHDEIIRAINKLQPIASTNAEAGLVLGYKLASQMYKFNSVNRVVLLSDGVANVGNTGPESIWESIKRYADEGITLTSIGVGMGNYNDVLLEQLADNGNGFYAYIDNMDEAERLFVHDLVGTLQVIAIDAKIQVDFNANVVERYRLVGFENRAIADNDFTNDSIDAAEIGAGHSVTALYEVKLVPNARGQIATVYLRWQNPNNGEIQEKTEMFFTDQMEESFRVSDPHFQLTVLVAEYAEVLRNSYWAENTSMNDLMRHLERTASLLEGEDGVFDLMEMVERTSWIQGSW